ncbi:hypothetical protein B4U79_13022, partial [Dinothrombium tinctorium]
WFNFTLLFVLLASGECISHLNKNEYTGNFELKLTYVRLISLARLVNELTNYCTVPRYAPYIYVKNVTSTAIIFGLTDPNDPDQVVGYSIYYWGFRAGVESTMLCVSILVGPYVIDRLKSGFVYCADVTAYNECGHGPYCVACFENISTLSSSKVSTL